jgi:hypothetical protein
MSTIRTATGIFIMLSKSLAMFVVFRIWRLSRMGISGLYIELTPRLEIGYNNQCLAFLKIEIKKQKKDKWGVVNHTLLPGDDVL